MDGSSTPCSPSRSSSSSSSIPPLVPSAVPPPVPPVPSAVPPPLPPIPFTRLIAIDPGIGNLVTCCDENNQITYVSGKEYRHRAKQKKWEHGLRERHDNYQALIQNMPSMKTADLATLRHSIQHRWRFGRYLFNFCKRHPFLKWRFTTFVYAQQALDWIAKKVVGPILPCFTRRSSWNRNWKLVPSGWSCQVNELKNHCPNMQR